MKIGILALQGGYEAHAKMLDRLGVAWRYVRAPQDLQDVQGMILPGGESSTALHLLQQNGLFSALSECAQQGMPFFGTCAGAILLAKHVSSPTQLSLGLMDVAIERNAYGRQLASRLTQGYCHLTKQPMPLCLIRAPRFSKLSAHIQVLADYEGEPVCIQEGNLMLATCHPELTEDTTLHQHFIDLVTKAVAK